MTGSSSRTQPEGKIKIVTRTKQFINMAVWEVEAGTTGLRGGDSGHGSRTYLRFRDQASTDMRVEVAPYRDEITLVLGGDAELVNLIAGLEFAVAVLKNAVDSPISKTAATGWRLVD